MKTYNKRIGFLVSYQTLVPHGGIGQFTQSFIRLMEENNIKVDIITDKKPQDNDFIKSLNTNLIYPEETYAYTNHSNIFMYGDSYCYERMANFRNAIIRALSNNLYDSLICNTYETVQVASTMGLEDVIQIIAYTHLESQIFPNTLHNPFLDSVNEMMRKQLEMTGIFVGTQSKFNQIEIDNGAWHLPIPFTETGLLQKHDKQREGVLFIGRWEEGKNPELYLKLIEETKLPARVMTNSNGAKKFEERLKKIGVDYKIAVSIIGQEKIDFISSCRVAFNPSSVESYGLAFIEQISQLPTVAMENMRWTKNFHPELFYTTDKKWASKVVKDIYDRFPTADSYYNEGKHDKVVCEELQSFDKWNSCFEAFKPRQSNSNTAKILTYDTVVYADYIEDLGRKIICIDDIRSVLTNKSKYATVLYTDRHTLLSKEKDYLPVVNDATTTFEDFFEFY